MILSGDYPEDIVYLSAQILTQECGKGNISVEDINKRPNLINFVEQINRLTHTLVLKINNHPDSTGYNAIYSVVNVWAQREFLGTLSIFVDEGIYLKSGVVPSKLNLRIEKTQILNVYAFDDGPLEAKQIINFEDVFRTSTDTHDDEKQKILKDMLYKILEKAIVTLKEPLRTEMEKALIELVG